jgi:hypothetical protein
MACRIFCNCCYRMFSFNPDRVPTQRVHTKGSRKLGKPIAYYPTCTYCREQVEVPASENLSAPLALAAQAG